MSGLFVSIHMSSFLGLGAFLIIWIVLFRVAHLLMTLLRHGPLIGWAIGPLGVTVVFLHEPSVVYIWLDVLFPALVSGSTLYVGLFTSISPVTLSHHVFTQILLVVCGVVVLSTGDILHAFHDLRHPLWGEARVLRTIQLLRSTWAKIHFTPFGYSYLNDHFDSSPTDLLRALQG